MTEANATPVHVDKAGVAPIVAAQFTQAAIDAAIPPKVKIEETPPDQAAAAAEPEPEAPPAPGSESPGGEKTKLQLAQEASAALIAKRDAARKARQATDDSAQRAQAEAARLAAERDAAAERARVAEAKAAEDPVEVARRRTEESTPEGRIAKLERELAERDRRDAQREHERQASQQQADVAQRERQFVAAVGEIKSGAEADAPLMYPLLAARAKRDPEIVVAEAHTIIKREIAQQRAKGVPEHLIKIPSNEDVYDYQEWLLEQANGASVPVAAATEPVVEAPPAPKKPNGTRTLSARKAGPPAVPKTYAQMTEAERLEWSAAELRRLHQK